MITFEAALSALSVGRWILEYRPSDPENGWTGSEPDYAPYTLTVVTYQDIDHKDELPEHEWLRYAGYDVESLIMWAAMDIYDDENGQQ